MGSNLCRELVSKGHRVISLDNYFAGSRENHVDGVEYREGHTKDIEQIIPERVDMIYHLGEYSRVEQSVLEPEIVHDLNTVGTAAVVEFWKKQKCKLLYAGSSTKFGDDGKTRETSPYARTKAANTELVKKVGDSEKLEYAITYFYNVFGPGERSGVYGTLIESYKQMYLRGTPLPVVSPGTQMRNFTHVSDIVRGLLLVGEKGEGDEFGLGNENAYTILEIAQMFGGDIVMMPERAGNRAKSALDTSKSNALGWRADVSVKDYIHEFVRNHKRGERIEKRVLVFSTTFYPVSGPAEDALFETIKAMPDLHFDVITTYFSKKGGQPMTLPANVTLYRVGIGNATDKYLLPILGFHKARKLSKSHSYLFIWALMASYAALAGILLKRANTLPLLISLADQDLHKLSATKRILLPHVLSEADQLYGDALQEESVARLQVGHGHSMGHGDAFANAIRFAYSGFLSQIKKHEKR